MNPLMPASREHPDTPPTSENFRDFYETVAARYPEEAQVYRSLRGQLRKRFVLSRLREMHGRLLDLGCNRGMYTAAYANGPAIGVDIALEALRSARRRCEAYFVQGDAQNLGFLRSATCDAILCSEVLEHVPAPQTLMAECYRVLRPHGTLLLTTPNYRKTRPRWVTVGAMGDYGVQGVADGRYFHTAYRPEELLTMAERAGFTVLEVGTLEKEVIFATRLPVLAYHILRGLNRVLFRSRRVDAWNERLLESTSQMIYRTAQRLRLSAFLTGLVREGVRSYLLATKTSE